MNHATQSQQAWEDNIVNYSHEVKSWCDECDEKTIHLEESFGNLLTDWRVMYICQKCETVS